MRKDVPATSKKADVSLVELEYQLEGALLEYERLCQSWPEESHVLSRAEAGGEVEDALVRIDELQYAIATSQAKTLPDAAVQIRRALAAIEAHDCKSPFAGPERTEIMLLASALVVIERMAP